MEYLLSVLDRDKKNLNAMHESGEIKLDLHNALIKKNSGIYEIVKNRMVPYVCCMTDLDNEETYHISFKEFETYYGNFPQNYNESQIMNHISDWCYDNGYSVTFKRKPN
jgi:hypothetical protein